MIAQGVIEIYVVDGEAFGLNLGDLNFCANITELPDIYSANERLILAFDFAPLEAWKLYRAVANQKVVFNASEWVRDVLSPYAYAVEAAQKDGALSRALADGKIIITYSPDPKPSTPDIYDIWETTSDLVEIGELSPADAEAFALSGSDKVYYYYGLDDEWHLCTEAMRSAIEGSVSTKYVKSQASVWNIVNVGTEKYINGWQSIIEYQNGGVTRNDFAIIADNFYIGAVGNVVQNGIDSAGNPIYESTGEAYKAFEVDIVNHKIKFSANVAIDGNLIVNGSISAVHLDANAISGKIITGGSIFGTTIEGVSILGSVIKSSWIDYTSTGALTNWQIYTPATVPSIYEANFAHNNTSGVLIADSNGYVRLPTTTGASSVYGMKTGSAAGADSASAITLAGMNGGVYSYASYQINTTKRFIAITPSFDVVNQLEYILDYEGTGGIM